MPITSLAPAAPLTPTRSGMTSHPGPRGPRRLAARLLRQRRNEAARPGFGKALHCASFHPFPAAFYERRAALRAVAA
jgi:hypothetical protein